MLNVPCLHHQPTTRDPITPDPAFTVPAFTGITDLNFGVPSRIIQPIRTGVARASLSMGVRIGEERGEATGAGGNRCPHAPDLAPRA